MPGDGNGPDQPAGTGVEPRRVTGGGRTLRGLAVPGLSLPLSQQGVTLLAGAGLSVWGLSAIGAYVGPHDAWLFMVGSAAAITLMRLKERLGGGSRGAARSRLLLLSVFPLVLLVCLLWFVLRMVVPESCNTMHLFFLIALPALLLDQSPRGLRALRGFNAIRLPGSKRAPAITRRDDGGSAS